MELMETLLSLSGITTQPYDIPNKQDLISHGVDFTDAHPTLIVKLPTDGAVINNIYIGSLNVVDVELIFTRKADGETTRVEGKADSLPKDQFPHDKVSQIVINVLNTTGNTSPKTVTLSVIGCAEGSTTVSAGEYAAGRFSS
jgi:hypothetical protein